MKETATTQSTFNTVCQMYSDGYSMPEIQKECKLANTAVRKILITAGLYSSEKSETAQKLKENYPDMSVADIAKHMGISVGYVNSLLPYSKGMYNIPEKSPAALKSQRFRGYHKIRTLAKQIADERYINTSPDRLDKAAELLEQVIKTLGA